MHKIISISLVLVCWLPALSAQNDCKPYIPTTKGTVWEITNYSAKGKETGRIVYELVDKVESDNETSFTIKNTTFDKKGKEIFANTFDAKCIDGKFELDMAYKMDGSAMQAYQNMEVNVDASKFEIPPMDAAPGTTLPDGSLKISMGGPIGLNMTVLVSDRKIEDKESVTTPAGTFDCLIISQTVSTKMVIAAMVTSKEWYSEQVGLVKSESYNKSGKLVGYSELTKFDKK